MHRTPIALLIFVLFLAGSAEAARRPGDPLKPGFNFFSKQQDVQLGQEAAAQVKQQYQVVQNPELQQYIARLGERLAATTEARQSGFPFTFTVVNQPEINAFALPGGPMFILSGLIKAADNEAQIAGVMGHEMAHVILRHGTHEASKANLVQLPAMLAGSVMGNNSILSTLTKLGANSFLLKFSRDAETEADALGSHLMAEAGYDPLEMARFFEKLNGAAGPGNSAVSQFMSDHPNPGNRERAIQAEAQTLPRRQYGSSVGDFARVKTQVNALPAPPRKAGTPQIGATAGQASGAPAPSGGWQQLRTQTLEVSYPGNWQPMGDRESNMITIAPREGIVQNNGAAQVGAGAILSYYVPDNRQTNLRAATDLLVRQLRASNPSMRLASTNPRRVRVAGADGLVTMLESASPFGGGETDALLTVMRPQGLFYMVFIAPDRDYPQVQAAFEQMMSSIRFTN